METLIFDPVVRPAVLAGGWVAAVLLCAAYAFWRPTRLLPKRRAALAVLHFIPLAAALLILHRPTWLRIAGEGGNKPVLAVLVDSSASMEADDAPDKTTRYAYVRKLAQQARTEWERDFDVQVRDFDSDVHAPGDAAAHANGATTDIAKALAGVIDGRPKPAALLIMSDGIHNVAESDLSAAGRTARAAGVPVFTCPVGSDVSVRDYGVVLSSSEELTFVNQRARIPVTITQIGMPDSEVDVELRQGGTLLESKKARFVGNTPEVNVDFAVSRDRAGLYTFDVVVPPQKGEALIANNRRRFALRVVDERIRVLLLEGKPYWDSKFLVRLLRRDPNVSLTTATFIRNDRVLLEAPPDEVAANGGTDEPAIRPAGASVPPIKPHNSRQPLEDREFLGHFQVVMLGRDAGTFLTEASVENLRDWISRTGGHLVCARGRPAEEKDLPAGVANILPVAWKSDAETRFTLDLTERGKSLALFETGAADKAADSPNVVLKSLPSLITATRVEQERSLTVVLARAQLEQGEPMAVLSMQNYGSGKTLVLEGQGMWRWAFRPPADALHGEEIYRAFWANMVRWLAGSNEFLPSQTLALRTGKPLYHCGERPMFYLLRKDVPNDAAAKASLKIELFRENDDGAEDRAFPKKLLEPQPVPREPLMLQAECTTLDEGHYRATIAGTEVQTAFEVLPPLKEKLDLRARPDLLQQLSDMTDGKLLNGAEVNGIGPAFRDYVRRHEPSKEIKQPAWDSAWVLLACFVCMGGTWWLRRTWGAI